MPEPIQEAQLRQLLRKSSGEHDRAAPASARLLCGLLMHELRTPLNAVAGFAELLLAGEAGPLTRDGIGLARAISRAAAAAACALATAQELVDLAAEPPAAPVGGGRVDLLPMLRRQGFTVPDGSGPGWTVPGPEESWERVLVGCRRYLAGGAGEELWLAATSHLTRAGLSLRLERVVPASGDGTGLIEFALARQLARRCGGRLDPADDNALVLTAAMSRQQKRRRNGAGS